MLKPNNITCKKDLSISNLKFHSYNIVNSKMFYKSKNLKL